MKVSNTQLTKEVLKLSSTQRLGKNVCQLFMNRNEDCTDHTYYQSILNKVTINFDMLGSFVENRVPSDIECFVTIAT